MTLADNSGIAGLRVAGASVFPAITTATAVVTVLMVGERAADLIPAGAERAACTLTQPCVM